MWAGGLTGALRGAVVTGRTDVTGGAIGRNWTHCVQNAVVACRTGSRHVAQSLLVAVHGGIAVGRRSASLWTIVPSGAYIPRSAVSRIGHLCRKCAIISRIAQARIRICSELVAVLSLVAGRAARRTRGPDIAVVRADRTGILVGILRAGGTVIAFGTQRFGICVEWTVVACIAGEAGALHEARLVGACGTHHRLRTVLGTHVAPAALEGRTGVAARTVVARGTVGEWGASAPGAVVPGHTAQALCGGGGPCVGQVVADVAAGVGGAASGAVALCGTDVPGGAVSGCRRGRCAGAVVARVAAGPIQSHQVVRAVLACRAGHRGGTARGTGVAHGALAATLARAQRPRVARA